MKKKEIKAALDALKKVRMPKIEDKELRNALIKNHLFLLGQNKKYEQDIEDLRTAHLGPYDETLQEIQELQNKLQTETDKTKANEIVAEINSHTEVLEAINGFNKAVMDLGNEDVELTLVSGDKFCEEYQNQDYDMNVVEALYPMFE